MSEQPEAQTEIEVADVLEMKVLRDDINPSELRLQLKALLSPLTIMDGKFRDEAFERLNAASEQVTRLAMFAASLRSSPPLASADPTGLLTQAHLENEAILQDVVDLALELARTCHRILLRIDNRKASSSYLQPKQHPIRVLPAQIVSEKKRISIELQKFLGAEIPATDPRWQPPLQLLGGDGFEYLEAQLSEIAG